MAGDTIAKDIELSVNVPLYLENQHYLTEKLSLVTGIQLNLCAAPFLRPVQQHHRRRPEPGREFLGFES
jgi:hypothetical protein